MTFIRQAIRLKAGAMETRNASKRTTPLMNITIVSSSSVAISRVTERVSEQPSFRDVDQQQICNRRGD